jgi:serine/threonine-protein kinase
VRKAGGRYVLGRLLGRGGMAEVYAGHALGSHGFQKPVAIKRLLPELTGDDDFVHRLIGEAKLLVGMQHGNVVSVLDLVRDGDDVFLVMELVEGPTLRQLLGARQAAAQGRLPLAIATHVLASACAGLEFAHARPGGAVIHADVSPSNLLLSAAGEVKVADFGIARREGVARAVEGKWAYMAPEQARGEPLSPRSDVFALGVVLYELVTGTHPFAKQVKDDGRDDALARQVPPPRAVRPDLPDDLDAICRRAMAYAPRERYPSAQAMADALVEVRFAHGWRDGAGELREAIRAARPDRAAIDAAGGGRARTEVTGRPVTIVTRSLITTADGDPRVAAPPTLTTGGQHAIAGAGEPASARGAADATGERAPWSSTAGEAGDGGHTPHAWSTRSVAAARRRLRAAWVMAAAAVAGAMVAVLVQALGPAPSLAPVAQARAPQPTASRSAAAITIAPAADDRRAGADAARAAASPRPRPSLTLASTPVSTPTGYTRAPSPTTTARPPGVGAAFTSSSRSSSSSSPSPGRGGRATGARDLGELRINATPWGRVEIAGRRVETPASLSLPAGTYQLKIVNPELGTRRSLPVTIRAGASKRLVVDLRR